MFNKDDLLQLSNNYPSDIQKELHRFIATVYEQNDSSLIDELSEPISKTLLDIASKSQYVRESLIKLPQLLSEWQVPDSELFCSYSSDHMESKLRGLLEEVSDEDELMSRLRIFRRIELTRIIWRDLCRLAPMHETVTDMSDLADACIRSALAYLTEWAHQKYGQPRSNEGDLQELIVLGLGKLGSRELNVSSDIDLIFAFPENGQTDHPEKPIENQKFFIRLGQRLIHVLSKITSDGFVFRVDMRLRPYGGSGALALNFSAFDDYYQTQGREWERFAMVKARSITGSEQTKEALEHIIRPFVYRRYTDFSSIAALREMKRLIVSEVHRKGGEDNIKLGSGGIREIEFIVQACQLIHGGKDLSLQSCSMLSILPLLGDNNYLPKEWVDTLEAANEFLRNMEHAIQGLNDQQTQLIPSDPLSRNQVAWSIGFDDWDAANKAMQTHRETIHQLFIEFLAEPETDSDDNCPECMEDHGWIGLWREGEEAIWCQALEESGFSDPRTAWLLVQEVRESHAYRAMSDLASRRFERFIVMFMGILAEIEPRDRVFLRVMELVRAVLGRSIYLVLLYENKEALKLLCRLCAESPWIAEHLSHYPSILDELLDAEALYQPTPKDVLKDELRQTLLRIPEEDLEAQMNALRHFKQSHVLKVAAAELAGKLPLMKVSDYLTWIAEVLVDESVSIAWTNLVEKHGLPAGLANVDSGSAQGFAVIGYGKLGGIELNYHSDLDMVFLFDVNDQLSTAGPKSINNQVFYTRLGQRVIHLLSTQTSQGGLYEVDMRLRPSGNSGMLVSSIKAFERYQRQDAWTWEHQALVRARFIAGDEQVAESFQHIRESVLSSERDNEALRDEVVSMREKMSQAAEDKFKSKEGADNDIKLGKGGLVDIEFITQFSVLSCSCASPELLKWTDNVRLLEAIQKASCHKGCGFEQLISAYTQLRAALHRQNLADDSYKASLADFESQRQVVQETWKSIMA